MPRSSARCTTARTGSISGIRPPKLLQPRPTTETAMPELPSLRVSISQFHEPLSALILRRREAPSRRMEYGLALRDALLRNAPQGEAGREPCRGQKLLRPLQPQNLPRL